MEKNKMQTKIKNNELNYNESDRFQKNECKGGKKSNTRASQVYAESKHKKIKLIKVDKESSKANEDVEKIERGDIDKKKNNENKMNKEMNIDNNKIETNIEKIENSIQKLSEIETKISDDMNECNKFMKFYEQSKSLLDSKDFNSDVGREQEINEIRTILKKCSSKFQAEGIFLTGPSGQGKTYSIFYIINEIEKEKGQKTKKGQKTEKGQTENYKNIDSSYFYVSCSNSEKPYDIFVDILQQITNKDKKSIVTDVKQKYSLNGLEEVKKLFVNYTSKLNNLKIVIVDELDFIAVKNVRLELKTKTQNKNYNEDVVKALFESVQNTKSKIILVGIANSLDLIKDYTHMKINQIIYKPYNEKQFMNIIRNKLNTLEDEFISKIFKGVSLNIHVRQISNRNGDIRSCFDAILRVFSDKKSDLEERKKNLSKLKEEIMINRIFNEQEKKNLVLLINRVDLKKRKINESHFSREGSNGITLTRSRRSSLKVAEKNHTDSLSGMNKKLKVGIGNNSSKDTHDSFNVDMNQTPLLSNREYDAETTISNNSQSIQFNNLNYDHSFDYNTLKKETIIIQNKKQTLSDILIRKNYESYDIESFYNYSQDTPMQHYESPFKVLYKNAENYEINQFKNQVDVLNNINLEKLASFDHIIENQMRSLEKKYEDLVSKVNNNTVMISDIKKITDKIPLEEHKDILFKIKSLPLIQKICLYASCNIVNDTHLNLYEDQQKNTQNKIQNIEITYADIQKGFRSVCCQLSETSYIKDILEGNTIDQAIEHFEELGILTNSKKNQKFKEKSVKIPKGLTPRFANKKNNKNFSSQNKLNSIYYFNLPVCVIKQTLEEISSILSSFDKFSNF